MRTSLKIFSLLLFVMFLIAVVLVNNHILYPASLSLQGDCGKITTEELAEKGFMVAGETTSYIDEDNTVKSDIVLYTSDIVTLRHEYCHSNQARNYRLFSCDYPKLLYLNEVECYTKQNLPFWDNQIKLMQNTTEVKYVGTD